MTMSDSMYNQSLTPSHDYPEAPSPSQPLPNHIYDWLPSIMSNYDSHYGTLNVPAWPQRHCFPTPDPPTVWVDDLIGSTSESQNPIDSDGRVPEDY